MKFKVSMLALAFPCIALSAPVEWVMDYDNNYNALLEQPQNEEVYQLTIKNNELTGQGGDYTITGELSHNLSQKAKNIYLKKIIQDKTVYFIGQSTDFTTYAGSWFDTDGNSGDFKIKDNSPTDIYKTCNEIMVHGQSHGDGIYSVDIDGDGPSIPFDVYCDMTNDGGGWTLVANHRLNRVAYPMTPVDYVSPDSFGVMTDEHWRAMRDLTEQGLMVVDENKLSSYISVDKMNAASCRKFRDKQSLLDGKFIFHNENNGCEIVGSDYSFLALDTVYKGAFQYSKIKFDKWPYVNLSYSNVSTMLFFVK